MKESYTSIKFFRLLSVSGSSPDKLLQETRLKLDPELDICFNKIPSLHFTTKSDSLQFSKVDQVAKATRKRPFQQIALEKTVHQN